MSLFQGNRLNDPEGITGVDFLNNWIRTMPLPFVFGNELLILQRAWKRGPTSAILPVFVSADEGGEKTCRREEKGSSQDPLPIAYVMKSQQAVRKVLNEGEGLHETLDPQGSQLSRHLQRAVWSIIFSIIQCFQK